MKPRRKSVRRPGKVKVASKNLSGTSTLAGRMEDGFAISANELEGCDLMGALAVRRMGRRAA